MHTAAYTLSLIVTKAACIEHYCRCGIIKLIFHNCSQVYMCILESSSDLSELKQLGRPESQNLKQEFSRLGAHHLNTTLLDSAVTTMPSTYMRKETDAKH